MRFTRGTYHVIRGDRCMFWGIVKNATNPYYGQYRFILFGKDGWPLEYRYLTAKEAKEYRSNARVKETNNA